MFLCDKLMLQVSYAIGVSKPLSIFIDTYGTEKVDTTVIQKVVENVFDFSPSNMINELNLKQAFYSKTTAYSHFGKANLPYEKLDKVDTIKEYVKKFYV